MSDYTVKRLREWGESLECEHKGGLGASLLGYAEAWEKQLAERDSALARCVDGISKAIAFLDEHDAGSPTSGHSANSRAVAALMTLTQTKASIPASAQATAKVLAECLWTPDIYGVWKTGCGETFILNDGTPKQNCMVFCLYCGKAIREEQETK